MEQLIYGIHPVRECLRSGARPVSCLYVARETGSSGLKAIVQLARRQGHTIRFEPRNLLDERVGGAKHQGVVAVCAARPYFELDDLLDGLGPAPLVVVLDSVEDPRNLGAVLEVLRGRRRGWGGCHQGPCRRGDAHRLQGGCRWTRVPLHRSGEQCRQSHRPAQGEGTMGGRAGNGATARLSGSGFDPGHGAGAGERRNGVEAAGAGKVRFPGFNSHAGTHQVAERVGSCRDCAL